MTQFTPDALNDLLVIINAYSSFTNERKMVRNFNKDDFLSNQIGRKINEHAIDYYSYSSREYGYSSGISETEIKEYIDYVEKLFKDEKDRLVENLILSEKYYKKLKHHFSDKYPEQTQLMKITMTNHQNNVENIKRKQHQKNKSIIAMSERFVSLFHYTFGGSDGLKIAYRNFSESMISKYDIRFDTTDELYNKLEVAYQHGDKPYVLDTGEIQQIATALKNFLYSISEEDIRDTDKYISNKNVDELKHNEKSKLVNEIINQNIERFKTLLSDYTKIKQS